MLSLQAILLLPTIFVPAPSSQALPMFLIDEPAEVERPPRPVVPPGEVYVPVLKLTSEVDDSSVKPLIDQIKWANDDGAAAIVLEINSPGGSVDDGFKLARAIEESKAPVHCVVDGEADSMAFYVLSSCATRSMTKRSLLMLHEPSVGGMFSGQQDKWYAIYRRLHVLSKAMAEHVCKHLTVTINECRSRMAFGREWWMTHDEAIKYNAVDAVVDSVKKVAEAQRKILQ